MNKEKRMAYCTNNTQVGFHTGNGTTDNMIDFEVADYIEIVKKYSENPTDTSILSDYSEMVTELAEWQTEAEELEEELEDVSPEELAEFSAEL